MSDEQDEKRPHPFLACQNPPGSEFDVLHLWSPERGVVVHVRIKARLFHLYGVLEEVIQRLVDREGWVGCLPEPLRSLLWPMHILFWLELVVVGGWRAYRIIRHLDRNKPSPLTANDILDVLMLADESVSASEAGDLIGALEVGDKESEKRIVRTFRDQRAKLWRVYGRDVALEEGLAAQRPICPALSVVLPDFDPPDPANAKGSNLVQ